MVWVGGIWSCCYLMIDAFPASWRRKLPILLPHKCLFFCQYLCRVKPSEISNVSLFGSYSTAYRNLYHSLKWCQNNCTSIPIDKFLMCSWTATLNAIIMGQGPKCRPHRQFYTNMFAVAQKRTSITTRNVLSTLSKFCSISFSIFLHLVFLFLLLFIVPPTRY